MPFYQRLPDTMASFFAEFACLRTSYFARVNQKREIYGNTSKSKNMVASIAKAIYFDPFVEQQLLESQVYTKVETHPQTLCFIGQSKSSMD